MLKDTISSDQQAYRKGLLEKPRKRRATLPPEERAIPPEVQEATKLSQAFNIYHASPEYRALYQDVLNNRFPVYHLIYLAFKAGFLAGRRNRKRKSKEA